MSTGSWRRNVFGLDITPKAVQALGENPTPASVRAALDIIGASRKTPEQKTNIYNLIGRKLLIMRIPERKDPDAIQMMKLIIDGVDGLIPPEFLLKYICRDSIQSGNIILVRHLFENPRFTDRADTYVQVAINSGHPEIILLFLILLFHV